MNWLRRVFLRRRVYDDLSAEIREHLEEKMEELVASGMPKRDAEAAARREFGNVTLLEERSREVWQRPRMESFFADIRYGMRMLQKSPGFTAVAVLTLALGIGATTAIFSVVNAVLLKSLPYRQSERLMLIQERIIKVSKRAIPVSAPDIAVMQRDNHVFESLAAFRTIALNLSGAGEPQRILAARASANLFPMLGAYPLLGRTFSPNEDPPGHFVTVLSYRLWEQHFGGDPGVVGRTIDLDGQPYTIIGVMPASFEFPPRGMPSPNGQTSSLWIPIAFTRQELANVGDNFDIGVIGRLKQGVTLAQTRSDMQVVANEVLKTWDALGPPVESMGLKLEVLVTPLEEVVISQVRTLLYLLLAAVGFLLLLACANVANLVLARAAGRQKEMSLRAALGARRARITRQLLTESVLLAFFGGASGLLLALVGTRAIAITAPDNIPQVQGITVDSNVLVFAILISVVTGILFGLVPALSAARVDLNEALKEAGRAPNSSRYVLFARNIFVVTQVSIAFVLIMGGGLLVRSFVLAENSNAGIQPRSVMTAALTLPVARYSDSSRVHSFFQQLFARMEAMPGIASIGAATDLPTEMDWDHIFSVEDHRLPASAKLPDCAHSLVMGNYFGAIGVHLVAGRFFTQEEEQGKSKVVIISAGMAKQYFAGESPLGKRLKWGPSESNQPWYTVVGVVNDVMQGALDEPIVPHTYAPYLQDCASREMMSYGVCSSVNVAIRARGGSAASINELRSAVEQLDPSQPVTDLRTLSQVLESSIAPRRFNTFLLTIFACTALFLAAIGVYSVLAYRVAQRTHEIGIRFALGAQRRDILRGVLASGAKLTSIGLILGAAASLALTRLMQSLLYDVSATDPLTFIAVAVLLTLIALLACYIPARRAMKVDPMVALRYE
jgi:predicted permease